MARPIDYDDDDFLPPARAASAGRGRGSAVFIVLGVVGLAVAAMVALFFFRSERAAEQRAMMQAEEAHLRAQGQANEEPIAMPGPRRRPGAIPPAAGAVAPGENWLRLIGTWQREPMEKDDTNYPYQFEFRSNSTATAISQQPEGGQRVTDGRVEVFVDYRDELALRLLVGNGVYVYRFQLKEDGTLVLNNGVAGLVFTRTK